MKFTELGLNSALLRAIEDEGYTEQIGRASCRERVCT